MDYQSIIRTITSALTTNSKSDVTIEEHFLFSHLSDKDPQETTPDDHSHSNNIWPRKNEWPKWEEIRTRRFPLTTFALNTIYILLYTVWISIAYYLVGGILSIFTGRKPKQLAQSPRYNAILCTTIIVLFIITVTATFSFFINDVLFFQKSIHSNPGGALVIEQPFSRTHYVYLFNTAEYWSNTHIELTKGDKIHITASGGFFNDIKKQCSAAHNNINDSSNQFIHIVNPDPDRYNYSAAMKECREMPEAQYGSLLYRIAPEVIIDSDSISKDQLIFDAKSPTTFTANASGFLQFCINDIYMTPEHIEKLSKDPTSSRLLRKRLHLEEATAESLADSLTGYRNIWYRDNNGEILLNIIVERSPWARSDISATNKPLMCIFGRFNSIINPPTEGHIARQLLWILLGIALWLTIDSLLIGRIPFRKKPNTDDGADT